MSKRRDIVSNQPAALVTQAQLVIYVKRILAIQLTLAINIEFKQQNYSVNPKYRLKRCHFLGNKGFEYAKTLLTYLKNYIVISRG